MNYNYRKEAELKKLYELQLQCVARYNYIERKQS